MLSHAHTGVTGHECFTLIFWIKTLYPIVFFSSLVYVIILLLNLFGAYSLKKNHPVIVDGYISLIHLLSYPLFLVGINGNAVCLIIFPYINLIWIVAIIIGHFVIHTFVEESVKLLETTPLHYHFLVSYFVSACLLEILMMIFKTKEIKKINPAALETKESDEGNSSDKNEKSPDNQYHTITIVNENPDDLLGYKVNTPKYVIEKQPFKHANKEQLTNQLMENQNSIRNIINQGSGGKKK